MGGALEAQDTERQGVLQTLEPDPYALLRTLVGEHPERLVHVHEVQARSASHADWPAWVDPTLLGALLGSARAVGV